MKNESDNVYRNVEIPSHHYPRVWLTRSECDVARVILTHEVKTMIYRDLKLFIEIPLNSAFSRFQNISNFRINLAEMVFLEL